MQKLEGQFLTGLAKHEAVGTVGELDFYPSLRALEESGTAGIEKDWLLAGNLKEEMFALGEK